MNFYIRCAAVSLASLAFLLSSSIMANKPVPETQAAVPATTVAAAEQAPRAN